MDEVDDLGVPIRKKGAAPQTASSAVDDLGVPIRKAPVEKKSLVSSPVSAAPSGPLVPPSEKAIPSIESRTDLIKTPYQLEQGKKEEEYQKELESDPLGALSVAGKRLGNFAVDQYGAAKDFVTNQLPAAAAGLLATAPENSANDPAFSQFASRNPDFNADQYLKNESAISRENKKRYIDFAINKQEESARKPIIRSLKEVAGVGDALNFVGGALTQSAIQIPLTVATLGGSAIGQEIGGATLDQIREIAQQKGISPLEVIDRGYYKPEVAALTGALSGSVDAATNLKIGKALTQPAVVKTLLRKARDVFKSGVLEATTEALQNAIVRGGTAIAANENVADKLTQNPQEYADEAAMGAIGGGGISAIGSTRTPTIQSNEQVSSGVNHAGFANGGTTVPGSGRADISGRGKEALSDGVPSVPSTASRISIANQDNANESVSAGDVQQGAVALPPLDKSQRAQQPAESFHLEGNQPTDVNLTFLKSLNEKELQAEHADALSRNDISWAATVEQIAQQKGIILPPANESVNPITSPDGGDRAGNPASGTVVSPESVLAPAETLPPTADTALSQPPPQQQLTTQDNAVIEGQVAQNNQQERQGISPLLREEGDNRDIAPAEQSQSDQAVGGDSLQQGGQGQEIASSPESAQRTADAKRMPKGQFLSKYADATEQEYTDRRESGVMAEGKHSFLDEVLNQKEVKPITDWIRSKKTTPGKGIAQSANPYDAFLELVAQAVETGNSIRNAVNIGIRELRKLNTSAAEAETIRNQFLHELNDTPQGLAWDNVKSRSKETAILRSNFDSFVTELKDKANHLKKGRAEGKAAFRDHTNDLKKQVADYLSANKKRFVGRVGAAKLREVFSKVNAIKTEKSLFSAVESIQNLLEDIHYDTKLSDAKKLRGTVQKLAKNTSVPQNSRQVLKAFSAINPASLDTFALGDYQQIAQNLAGTFSNKTNQSLVTNDQVADFTNKITSQQNADKKATLLADNQYLVDTKVLDDQMSLPEIETVLDGIEEPGAASETQVSKTRQTIEDNIAELQEGHWASLEANPETKGLTKLTLDRFSVKELRLLHNVLTNIIDNNDLSGIDQILNKQQAIDRVTEMKPHLEGMVRNIVWSANALTKLVGKGVILPLSSESGLFRRLSVLKDLGIKVHSMVSDAINTGYERSVKEYERGATELRKLTKKMDNGALTEVGMYGFVNDHNGGTDLDIANDFAESKKLLQTSIDHEKAHPDRQKEAARRQAIFDKLIAPASSAAEVLAKLSPKQRAVYDWMRAWQDAQEPFLQRNAERFHNEPFEKTVNHVNRVLRTLEPEPAPLDGLDVPFTQTTIDRQQIGQMKSRTATASTLNENKYYELNIGSIWQSTAKKTLYDKHTLQARDIANNILRDKDFRKQVGGQNAKILLDRVANTVATQKGMGEARALAKLLQPFRRGGARTLVGRPEKILTETIPQYLQYLASQRNPEALFTAINIARKGDFGNGRKLSDLLEQLGSSVIIRDAQGDADLKAQTDRDFDDGKLRQAWESATHGVDHVLELLSTGLLRLGDRGVSKHMWLASYLNSLMKQGLIKKASEFDVDNPVVNEEAKTHANALVGTINAPSNPTTGAAFFNNQSDAAEVSKTAAFFLRKFSVNQSMEASLAIRNLVESNGTDATSWRHLAGAASNLMLYSLMGAAIKRTLYEPASRAVLSALGYEESEEDKEKRKARQEKKDAAAVSDAAKKAVGDLTLGWLPEQMDVATRHLVELARKEHVRQNAYQRALKQGLSAKEANKQATAAVSESAALFFDKPFTTSDLLGGYGYTLQMAQEAGSTLQDLDPNQGLLSPRAVSSVYAKALGAYLFPGVAVEINRRVSLEIERRQRRLKSFTTTYMDATPGVDGRKKAVVSPPRVNAETEW